MIIQSRFKDYYDYVGHVYGADPIVVYERKPLTDLNEFGYRRDFKVDINLDFALPNFWSPPEDQRFKYKALVIMNTAYLLQSDRGGPFVLYDWEIDKQELRRKYYWAKNLDRHYPDSLPRDCLIDLTRVVGQPVFMIETIQSMRFGNGTEPKTVTIASEIPILADYGIPAIYSATQLFQDLTYYIGNTMKLSPDVSPPAEVDSLVRLEQRGFDKKISFRHRTKNA